MAKSEASVEELVSMIERGELRLPEMQRRYVWRSTRVRDLLDSLYRGYPSGAILLWETDEEVPLQDFSVKQQNNPYKSTRLLLDGQQRLTSLSSVIRGEPVTVRGRKKPIDILFNLDHPDQLTGATDIDEDDDQDDDEEDNDRDEITDEADSTEDELQQRFDKKTFVIATKKLEQLPQWVKVTEVFKSDNDAAFLTRAGVKDLNDPKYQRYSQRLARLRSIKKYVYRMDVLERTLSYDEVTEIFVRVNSLGAKLRSSDLALAQITAKWRGALKTFQAFQTQCASEGFDLELGVFLKSLVAAITNQSRFLTINSISLEELKSGWKESVKGMEFASSFLRNNAKIDSPILLSSPFLLVALARFGHKRNYQFSKGESEQLRRWALLANAKGRYSRGATETMLDQDLAIIRDDGQVVDLVEKIRQQVGLLRISPEELEGRNQRSSLFKTMFLAFREDGAKDWKSNLSIAFDHSGAQHRLQFHHIFPQALLKGTYSSREADDIANLCFISGKTNRNISDKSPADYFPALIESAGQSAFDSQCIPTDPRLLKTENYKEFLSARRKLIATRLNDFLAAL
jgi:hypothetical protein